MVHAGKTGSLFFHVGGRAMTLHYLKEGDTKHKMQGFEEACLAN